MAASEKYQVRKEVEKKSRYDKEVYLDEIAKIHQVEASAVTKVKISHENKLRVLEQLESRKIADLTKTIAAQKAAMQSLQVVSPAMRRNMQPRKAYHFRSRQYSNAMGRT